LLQLITRAKQTLELRVVPEPEPGPGEATVAVEAVGICGSDLHLLSGDHPYSRFPLVQGHEFAGRVAALPDGYDGSIRVGDRVAVEPLLPCGTCIACRRGRTNCCLRMRTYGAHLDGALSEIICVPTSLLFAVDDLTSDLAALVEPVSIGVHAVGRVSIEPGEKVVIFGAGPIGQAILLAAVERHASTLVVDRLESRLALAHAFGATETALAADATESIAAWTSGDGPTVVFEATGVPGVLEQAIDLVASSGSVVVVGLSRMSVSVPMVEFTRKELAVLGSRNSAGEFPAAVDLVRSNRVKLERLITHRFDLEDGRAAFLQAQDHPDETGKVIIHMGGASG